jgi:hypothetical protein
MNLEEMFDKCEDEYIKFDRVENKRSNRPDLHAFLLLDELMPGTRDMVSAAEHDEIYLDIDVEAFRSIATEQNVIELSRCGVRYDDDLDCFCMFV